MGSSGALREARDDLYLRVWRAMQVLAPIARYLRAKIIEEVDVCISSNASYYSHLNSIRRAQNEVQELDDYGNKVGSKCTDLVARLKRIRVVGL